MAWTPTCFYHLMMIAAFTLFSLPAHAKFAYVDYRDVPIDRVIENLTRAHKVSTLLSPVFPGPDLGR